jgi:hypothetical protein
VLTLGDLKEQIERLEDDDEVTNDTEVRLIHQSNYPLQHRFCGVTSRQQIAHRMVESGREEAVEQGITDFDDFDEDVRMQMEAISDRGERDNVIYLVECGQVYERPYGWKEAWQCI